MIKFAWAVCCRRILIDRETNAASYIDAVHGLVTKELPMPFPPMMLGSVWSTDELGAELRQRVEVVAPSGSLVYDFESEPLELTTTIHRYNLSFGGFEVQEMGAYTIRVQLADAAEGQWTTVAELPLSVQLAEQEEAVTEEESDEAEGDPGAG